MQLQIALVALNKLHKILVAKNIMCHQVEMTITLMCNLHPLFIQLTSNLCNMVIYDWFLQNM
jgi:hypothetical protein